MTRAPLIAVILLVLGVTAVHADTAEGDAGLHLVGFRASDAGALQQLVIEVGKHRAVTNADGVARMQVAAGTIDVCLTHAAFKRPATCIPLKFRRGQISLLMVTFNAEGKVNHLR